jgi:hypothetical protein
VTPEFEILAGLPSTGPLPAWVPEGWRRSGGEGFVVRFSTEREGEWTANFQLGGVEYFGVAQHPNGREWLVVAGGNPYLVDKRTQFARRLDDFMPVSGIWPIIDSCDLLLELQGLAFLRLGPERVSWHSRRISWDGFQGVAVGRDAVTGHAWSPIGADPLHPFSVDLRSGRVSGGAPDVPNSDWERLAESPPESS